MKKLAVLILLTIVLGLVACQPSPEPPKVHNEVFDEKGNIDEWTDAYKQINVQEGEVFEYWNYATKEWDLFSFKNGGIVGELAYSIKEDENLPYKNKKIIYYENMEAMWLTVEADGSITVELYKKRLRK